MIEKPTYEELEKKVEDLERAAIESKQHEGKLKIYQNIVSSTPDGVSFLDKNYKYMKTRCGHLLYLRRRYIPA